MQNIGITKRNAINVGIKSDFNHINTSIIIDAAGTDFIIVTQGEKIVYIDLLNDDNAANETPIIKAKIKPQKILANEKNIAL